jgi:hypothetical protein
MDDTRTALQVLRTSGYRCAFRDESGRRCGAPASLAVHPTPAPNPRPMIAVCRAHAVEVVTQ